MSEQKDLEQAVDKIFRKSRLTSTQSSKSRLHIILKRCKHELSIKNLLRFMGRIIWVMQSLLSSYLKIIFKPR